MERRGFAVRQVPVLSRTLEPAQHTNDYLIGDHQEAVLVDAGWSDASGHAELWKAWEAAGRPHVRAILLTHGHHDHARGVQDLAARWGAPVYAHPAEFPRIRQLNPDLPLREAREGDMFTVAGRHLRALETPGHTSGHLAFWLEEQAWLFCGDVMAGRGTVWVGPPDGDMRVYLDTLRRIRSLSPRRIGPGHGPWIDEPVPAVLELIDHRLQREAQILEQLRQNPAGVAALARAIYEGEIPPRMLPYAEGVVSAHLAKLVVEGRVIAEDDGSGDPIQYRIV